MSFLVSPLLFETNQHELTHHTLLIDANESPTNSPGQPTLMAKVLNKFKMLSRYKCLGLDKRALADDIVVNDGHLDHLYQQLTVLHQQYLKRAEKKQS